MYVVPAEGLSIRDPDLGDRLPKEGREVPSSEYWHRRIRDLDVLPGKAPEPVEPASLAAPAAAPVVSAPPIPAAE